MNKALKKISAFLLFFIGYALTISFLNFAIDLPELRMTDRPYAQKLVLTYICAVLIYVYFVFVLVIKPHSTSK